MKRTNFIFSALLALSVVFLLIILYLIISYGRTVYFVAFHKPFHISVSRSYTRATPAPALPIFHVSANIALNTLAAGKTQVITVQTDVSKETQGFLEVWIQGPNNKQVYRNSLDENTPEHFLPGRTQSFVFTYVAPANLPNGTYRVSTLITSPNLQTDYYVNEDFTSFTIR